jgi:D-aspartate ligase
LNRSDDQLIALLIGFSVNGWNVYRSLSGAGVKVVALDDDRESIFWKARGVELHHAPRLWGEELMTALHGLADSNRKYVVISAIEDAVRTLSERRAELPANVFHLFPAHFIVDLLLDKRMFYNAAVERKHLISRMGFLETWTDLPKADEIRFPCILKGRTKLYAPGLAKAYRLENLTGLRETVEHIAGIPGVSPQDFVTQEWVPGPDSNVVFCMQYYDTAGDLKASFVGRKIRQWRPQTGGTSSAEPIVDEEALIETTRFFRSIGMRGICSMEFKRSAQDGKLYMIEPTACRADYQEGVAVANGCNLPLMAYLDASGRSCAIQPSARRVKWINMGEDRASAAQYIEQGELSWWGWWRSIRGPKTYAIYAPENPGPFLEMVRRRVLSRLWS